MKKITTILSLIILISCNTESSKLGKIKSDNHTRDSLNTIIQKRGRIIDSLENALFDLSHYNSIDTNAYKPNELYSEIIPIKLTKNPYVEAMNSIDTSISYLEREIGVYVRIFVCTNGPSDPELEYCNGSNNMYIATTIPDLPPEYNLHEVGPYFDLKIDSINSITSTLFFHHDVKGKKTIQELHISIDSLEFK